MLNKHKRRNIARNDNSIPWKMAQQSAFVTTGKGKGPREKIGHTWGRN